MAPFVLLLGCVAELPPELAPGPSAVTAPPPEPTDPVAKVAWMIGDDPLARRPRVPATGFDPAVDAFGAVSATAAERPDTWWGLEARFPGTLAVPLARGARLAAVEPHYPDFHGLDSWLLPLPPPPAPVEHARSPLDWLGPAEPADVLAVLERDVLLGWLDGPSLPLAPVAHAIRTSTSGRAAQTPSGRLILARVDATGTSDVPGFVEATRLALVHVAADTDREEAEWKKLRGDGPDPIAERLRLNELDGRDDAAVGRSLVAQAGLRWANACDDKPCQGFDRARDLAAAERWGADPTRYAHAWEVVFLKDGVDQLLTAWDTPFVAFAVDRVTEALYDVGGLDQSVLQHRDLAPQSLLLFNRALGAGDLTSKDATFASLNRHLAARARAALGDADPAWQEPLTRIARRAELEAGK